MRQRTLIRTGFPGDSFDWFSQAALNRPGFDGDSVSTERWADVSTEEVFTGVAGASGPARF